MSPIRRLLTRLRNTRKEGAWEHAAKAVERYVNDLEERTSARYAVSLQEQLAKARAECERLEAVAVAQAFRLHEERDRARRWAAAWKRDARIRKKLFRGRLIRSR